MPYRALATLLLAALLCACRPDREPVDAGPAEPPAAMTAALREAKRERVLFKELGALRLAEQQVTSKQIEERGAIAKRWRAYRRAAAGTPYEPLAVERIEAYEADASRELSGLRGLRGRLRDAYMDADRKRALREAETFITLHPETRAAAQARDWAHRIDRALRASPTTTLLRIGAKDRPWKESIASGQVRAQHILHKASSVHLVSPGQSTVVVFFDVDEVPERTELRLNHVAAVAAGNEYATVDVAVNGKGLCVDWNVGSKWLTWNFRRHRWPIGPWIQRGRNAVMVRMGQSALARYWLLNLEIRTGGPPPFERVLAD